MFTGIIEEIGSLRRRTDGGEWGSLVIQAKSVLDGAKLGDSIAVNGVCLTVTKLLPDGFSADVMMETLKRTSLGDLKSGSAVNLERALTLSTRLGGHIVSGHIDGVGTISSMAKEGNSIRLTISADTVLLNQILEKGSIAIDGVSLTVIDVTSQTFSVGIIPHTGGNTILLGKKPGDRVNLETDIIGKYVYRFLSTKDDTHKTQSTSPALTMDFLIQNGF